MRFLPLLLALPLITACSASGSGKNDEDPLTPTDSGNTGDGFVADTATDGGATDGGIDPDGSLDSSGPTPPAEVWAHSSDTLYKLDPDTKNVTVIGPFVGCSGVVDMALDEKSNLYVSAGGIYKVDKKTAACTKVGGGTFAGNSLSFVPVGVL